MIHNIKACEGECGRRKRYTVWMKYVIEHQNYNLTPTTLSLQEEKIQLGKVAEALKKE